MSVKVQKAHRRQKENLKRNSTNLVTVQMLNMHNKERIQKVAREKHQLTYKDRNIRIIADIIVETVKARRNQTNVLQAPKPFQPAIPSKAISFNQRKLFMIKNRFRKSMIIKPKCVADHVG